MKRNKYSEDSSINVDKFTLYAKYGMPAGISRVVCVPFTNHCKYRPVRSKGFKHQNQINKS